MSAPNAARENSPIPRTTAWILVAITTSALAVRLFRLDAFPLWTDEIFSYSVARMDWLDLIAFQDQTPPLFVAALHVWIGIGGASEGWIRMLSVLAGVGAIPLAFFLTRRYSGDTGALLAALLCATSLDFIIVSQEARSYALFVVATAASFLSLVRLPEKWSPGRAAVYVALTVAMLYCHVYGIFFALAQQVWFILQGRSTIHWRHWLLIQGAVAVLFLPWLPVLWAASSHVAGGFWIQKPGISDAALTLRHLLGFRPLAYITCIAIVAALWFDVQRRDRSRLLLWTWMVVPIAASVAISFVSPIYWPLYILPAAVAAACLAGQGFDLLLQPRHMAVRATAIACIALLAVTPIASFYANGQTSDGKQDWRGTFEILDAHASPNATVVMNTGLCATGMPSPACPYDLYGSRSDIVFLPFFREDRGRAQTVDENNVVALEPLVAGKSEVWVLYTYMRDPERHILEELDSLGYKEAGSWTLKRVELHRFELTPAT